jgi:MFS transporter, PAT family, beta-lactamase induction signal transducer AmpG
VKRPPPWLFILTGTPYGVVGSFIGVVMPNLTQAAKIELGSIGWFSTLLFVPSILVFLYAPIIDIGPRRKYWLVLMAAIGGACLGATFLMRLPDHITAFLVLGFAANFLSGLVGSCNGALMATTMPDELRGKAGGWYNVGNLSGGAVSAAITISLVGHDVDRRIVAAAVFAMMVLPSLAALWIEEPVRAPATTRQVFRDTLSDVGRVLFSKTGITGIALCVSPVGTAALINYFGGMSDAYRVGPDTVATVTGLMAAGLNALGAGIVGYLCDRYNRRVLYLASGALTAVCGIVMALSPRSPLTYVVGVAAYALVAGFCYAAFTSTVLETIGKAGKYAATQYALFVAAGNVGITYVGLIDTRFNDKHGVEGVIGSDAVLNIAGVIVLALVFWRLGSFGKWRHPAGAADPEPEPLLGTHPEPVLPTAIARIADRDKDAP